MIRRGVPANPQLAPRQLYDDLTLHTPGRGAGHRHGARARAARQRRARTTLPRPHANSIIAQHLHELHVYPPRKRLVPLDDRPHPSQRYSRDIMAEQHSVRIGNAHLNHR